MAAGLENGGKIPVVSCAGSFLSARATEQIKIDAAYSHRHMLLCAQSPGLAYGQLGSTHHSAEDVSIMRAIPDMTVIVPADPAETAGAVHWAYSELDGPAYIRVSRMKVPAVHGEDYVFTPEAVTVRDGADLTIIANGTALHRAIEAADRLAADGVPGSCRFPSSSRSTRMPFSQRPVRRVASSPSRRAPSRAAWAAPSPSSPPTGAPSRSGGSAFPTSSPPPDPRPGSWITGASPPRASSPPRAG